MTRNPLDPSLAAILDSIRATVDGTTPADESDTQKTGTGPAAPAAPVTATAPAHAPVRSIEDFLTDLVRPQVQQWVEANLPEIVQKLVTEEVQRLTGQKG